MSDLPQRDLSLGYIGPRMWLAGVIVLVFMVGLTARLWHLQLVKGEAFDELSKSNRIRLVRLPPSRGRILDSKGRVMAENKPSFTFSIVPAEVNNRSDLIDICAPVLGFTPEKMRGILERSGSTPRFMQFPIKKNLTLEELSLIKSRTAYLRGVTLEVKPFRGYSMGETLCHEIGIMGEISPEELAKGSRTGYRSGDLIGKSGIEKEYENYLKGGEGWEQIEIDAKGRQLANLSRTPPRAGSDIVLTIDSEFQRYAEQIFIHRAGSIVAVDPDTGRVLAMVSKPGFDLSLFSPSISEHKWKALNSDPLHPLENKSVRGLYSPASTFKIVTAIAALAEKVVKPEERVMCKGYIELAGLEFRCWNHYGHGKVSLRRAVAESCDSYFYEMGLRLGPNRIAQYAALFGLGTPTGVSIPQEPPGLVPTPAWKWRTHADSWKDGETVTLAIGQGYLVCTPLQLAMMTAAVANGGKLIKPAVVRQIRSQDADVVFEHEPTVRWELPLDPNDLSLMRQAFRDAVQNEKGTAKKCRIPGINVRAKTGTSQVISARQRPDEGDQVPYHERTHAMIVAYVDDQPKKIAVVVIVEHGGGGGANAAPIARQLIARYYGMPDPGDPPEARQR